MIRVASVKYIFPQPLDIRYTGFKEKSARVQVLDVDTNLKISEITLIQRL